MIILLLFLAVRGSVHASTTLKQVDLEDKVSVKSKPFDASVNIQFHGGYVMSNGANVYIIWYGTWLPKQKTIILSFINSLGPKNPALTNTVQKWWKINSLYYNSSGSNILTTISLVKQVVDNYSHGKALNDSSISQIVLAILQSGSLPTDNNGIYLVLTSADVKKSLFCSVYCGYHQYTNAKGINVKYAFVGNPSQCPFNGCSMGQQYSPNGDAGIDAMVSTIAHEMSESLTDPYLNAWYDGVTGNECADTCAWTFGNMFLVQQNLNPKNGNCVLSL